MRPKPPSRPRQYRAIVLSSLRDSPSGRAHTETRSRLEDKPPQCPKRPGFAFSLQGLRVTPPRRGAAAPFTVCPASRRGFSSQPGNRPVQGFSMRIDKIAVGRKPRDNVNVIVDVPVGGEPMKYDWTRKLT